MNTVEPAWADLSGGPAEKSGLSRGNPTKEKNSIKFFFHHLIMIKFYRPVFY